MRGQVHKIRNIIEMLSDLSNKLWLYCYTEGRTAHGNLQNKLKHLIA